MPDEITSKNNLNEFSFNTLSRINAWGIDNFIHKVVNYNKVDKQAFLNTIYGLSEQKKYNKTIIKNIILSKISVLTGGFLPYLNNGTFEIVNSITAITSSENQLNNFSLDHLKLILHNLEQLAFEIKNRVENNLSVPSMAKNAYVFIPEFIFSLNSLQVNKQLSDLSEKGLSNYSLYLNHDFNNIINIIHDLSYSNENISNENIFDCYLIAELCERNPESLDLTRITWFRELSKLISVLPELSVYLKNTKKINYLIEKHSEKDFNNELKLFGEYIKNIDINIYNVVNILFRIIDSTNSRLCIFKCFEFIDLYKNNIKLINELKSFPTDFDKILFENIPSLSKLFELINELDLISKIDENDIKYLIKSINNSPKTNQEKLNNLKKYSISELEEYAQHFVSLLTNTLKSSAERINFQYKDKIDNGLSEDSRIKYIKTFFTGKYNDIICNLEKLERIPESYDGVIFKKTKYAKKIINKIYDFELKINHNFSKEHLADVENHLREIINSDKENIVNHLKRFEEYIENNGNKIKKKQKHHKNIHEISNLHVFSSYDDEFKQRLYEFSSSYLSKLVYKIKKPRNIQSLIETLSKVLITAGKDKDSEYLSNLKDRELLGLLDITNNIKVLMEENIELYDIDTNKYGLNESNIFGLSNYQIIEDLIKEITKEINYFSDNFKLNPKEIENIYTLKKMILEREELYRIEAFFKLANLKTIEVITGKIHKDGNFIDDLSNHIDKISDEKTKDSFEQIKFLIKSAKL